MCPDSSAQITRLFDNQCQGDQKAQDAVVSLVYEELRRLARQRLWHQRTSGLCSRNLHSGKIWRTSSEWRHK
jgi:ECF sigma factor